MKKILFFVALLMSTINVRSQSNIDTTVKLDLLKAPSSPASSLLGIAPTDIDKPTDLSAFMVSLQSASSSFTKLPANYAVDFAPYWLFNKKPDNSINGLGNTKGAIVPKQTLVISFAFRNTDSSETTLSKNSIYGGIGFKFSVIRGEFTDEVKASLKKIQDYQAERTLSTMAKIKKVEILEEIVKKEALLDSMLIKDPKRKNDETKQLQNELNALFQKHLNGVPADNTDLQKAKEEQVKQEKEFEEKEKQIRDLAAAFQIERCGWNWDVAGGISTEFRDKAFNNTKVYNAGLWTTAGYTGKKGSTFLFILRYLYNPDKVFAKDNAAPDVANISTVDGGLKYCFSSPQSKLNISMEALYRSVLSSKTIDPSYRLVFNADYAIWQNQKLTFSFGRNFDGVVTKGGNLVAALSFLTGFGNNR